MGILLTSSGGIFLIGELRKAAVISDVKQTLQRSFHSCPDLGTSVLRWFGSEGLSCLAQPVCLLAFFLLVRSTSVFQALTVVTASVAESAPAVFTEIEAVLPQSSVGLKQSLLSSLLVCCD